MGKKRKLSKNPEEFMNNSIDERLLEIRVSIDRLERSIDILGRMTDRIGEQIHKFYMEMEKFNKFEEEMKTKFEIPPDNKDATRYIG